jgi:type I restriction enzyme S subunit
MIELKKVKLGEICDITSSKRIFFSEYVDMGIPFYRSKEIIELSNGQSISELLYISENKYNEIKLKFGVPKENDILLTSVGSIGVPYIVNKKDKFYFKDGNLIWFRNFQNNSNYIIYDFLNSKQFKNKIEQISIGSTQTALTISGLSKIKIQIPNSINYQRYIEQSKVIQKSVQQNNTELENLYYLKNILISQISKR